ncbi:MAG: TatD family hydrolase [Limnochordaceae bacterium]|nr:TatD family hydrolase [Limnochordaceae bacterium]
MDREPSAPSALWIDSHCHLNDESFASDLETVWARACEAGVVQAIVPGYDVASSRRALALARQLPRALFAAVAIHPDQADQVTDTDWAELTDLTRQPEVVAIGETGLDFHYPTPSRQAQMDLFQRHLELAVQLRLPVIVHSREAEDETLRLLRKAGWSTTAAPAPGCQVILHCFMGSEAYAREALALGCMISLSGALTFRKLEALRELVSRLPGGRLLVETDAPYLAPEPYRGRRNEPAWVALVGQRLAAVRGEDVQAMSRQLCENTRRAFRLPPAPAQTLGVPKVILPG